MRFKDFINEDINMQAQTTAPTAGQPQQAQQPQPQQQQPANPAMQRINKSLQQIGKDTSSITNPLQKKAVMNATTDFQKLLAQPNNPQTQNSIANRTMNNQRFAPNQPNRNTNFGNQPNMPNMNYGNNMNASN